jgi:hypothetical protein
VQIGQGRGGFYSYDWLENLAGCKIHSADRIHPEWQEVRTGDTVAVLPGWGPTILAVEPGQTLVVEGWGTFAVRPIDHQTARLIVRARQTRGWAAWFYLLTLEIPHFIMERKILLGLKQRAELATGGPWLIDEVMPEYQYRGQAAVVIDASPPVIFRALRQVTLAEMPLAYALGTIRYLPGILTGRMKRRPEELRRPSASWWSAPLANSTTCSTSKSCRSTVRQPSNDSTRRTTRSTPRAFVLPAGATRPAPPCWQSTEPRPLGQAPAGSSRCTGTCWSAGRGTYCCGCCSRRSSGERSASC